MSTVIKAIRATMMLGDTELEVFQKPGGDYVTNSTNLSNLLEITQKEIIINYLSQELKARLCKHPKFLQMGEKLSVESVKVKINAIPIELVGLICSHYAKKGNKVAEAILEASLIEALERRADNAFNVLRTEEERNQRFVVRRDGILSRNFWTDCIQEYCKTHEVSEDYKKWIYANVSDMVNMALFGIKSKAVKEHYQLPKGISIRDYLPSETLKLVDTIEKASAVRVQNNDVCPKQALKDVIGILGIEPSQDRL